MFEPHSDRWLERALDGELSTEEQQWWEAHRATCEACRQEWAALAQLDWMLQRAPAPLVPAGFEQRTLARVQRSWRRQRRQTLLTGWLSLFLLIVLVGSLVTPAFLTLRQAVGLFLAEWTIWLEALARPLIGFLVTVRLTFPLLLLGAGLILLLLIPNGALATLAYVWLNRRYVAGSTG